ncbi:hypothetical protein B0H34DRAFT_22985 [Crassisporium funariophilum]|nr:hypothetical protein B0H34DRAFT_22985 [Crassisporium funariophilum]
MSGRLWSMIDQRAWLTVAAVGLDGLKAHGGVWWVPQEGEKESFEIPIALIDGRSGVGCFLYCRSRIVDKESRCITRLSIEDFPRNLPVTSW